MIMIVVEMKVVVVMVMMGGGDGDDVGEGVVPGLHLTYVISFSPYNSLMR